MTKRSRHVEVHTNYVSRVHKAVRSSFPKYINCHHFSRFARSSCPKNFRIRVHVSQLGQNCKIKAVFMMLFYCFWFLGRSFMFFRNRAYFFKINEKGTDEKKWQNQYAYGAQRTIDYVGSFRFLSWERRKGAKSASRERRRRKRCHPRTRREGAECFHAHFVGQALCGNSLWK